MFKKRTSSSLFISGLVAVAPLLLAPKGCDGEGEVCGGLTGAACERGEYCDFPPDASCGAADQTGTCAPIPDACDLIFDPVCGCDGRTYSNACLANLAGVSVASDGECDGGPGAVCGGLLGTQCPNDQFCDFPPGATCGFADATGICELRPTVCTDDFNPVCGCDGRTYSNACEANAAGFSVLSNGPCR
jgi:hypothetical protein